METKGQLRKECEGPVVEDNKISNIPEPTTNNDKNSAFSYLDKLNTDFNAWCELLTTHSMQACYALIAANWAVHGNIQHILCNIYSKWSIAIVLGFIGINLLLNWLMVQFHFSQYIHAERDIDAWTKEYIDYKDHVGDRTYWPYYKRIEYLGHFFRFIKMIFPFIAAVLFIKSLF